MDASPWTKYYPPQAQLALGMAGKRLPSLLADAVASFPERTALVSPQERWTFAQLDSAAQSLAASLRAAGIADGERVAILLPNVPEYVAALFATWQVGGTVVQVNPAYVAPEIMRILGHSGTSALVTTQAQLQKLNDAGFDPEMEVFLVGEGQDAFVQQPGRRVPQAQPGTWQDASPEIAVLQYTGGTTGLPKAVMLTHENLLSNIEQRLRLTFNVIAVPDGAKVVNTLPMCHVYGLVCVTLTCVKIGMEQLLVPRFQSRAVLELIRDARPFAFYGVPTMYAAFLREPDLETFGLQRVSVFNSAGAPMPPAHRTQFEARVGLPVLSGFGISESSPTTHTYPAYLPRRDGSSGIPVPFTEVRVVRATDTELVDVPVGDIGELAIRGPQVMRGYWGEPALTARTIRDGWLLTGDLVQVDDDGFLYVVGRDKDVIVASGYNVYPAEIERVIGNLENIAEVAVVGIPDAYRGETVKAVIVPVQGRQVDPEAVIAHCRTELAPFKVPAVLEIVSELPRTAVGKIDKRALSAAGDTTQQGNQP